MKLISLTHARLLEMITYDQETGVFTRRIASGNLSAGAVAGGRGGRYSQIRLDGIAYLSHRLAWFYVHGVWPESQIDHINGDQFDNRLCNLRLASSSVNNQNRVMASGASGYRGAFPSHSKWMARIKMDGLNVYLGTYDTPQEAHRAYLDARAVRYPLNPMPRVQGQRLAIS